GAAAPTPEPPAAAAPPPPPAPAPAAAAAASAGPESAGPVDVDAIVEALRKSNRIFFGTALARARFEADGNRLVISLGGNFEQQRVEARRAWIEDIVASTCGRRLRV